VENSPNTILEAQAVGLPVIGTNYGAIPELVQHEENGLLFQLDDAADLARQLQRFLDEPGLLKQLRSKQIPFRLVEEEISQLENLYQELATQQQGQTALV
jgi:glycosyltransferase involved in cell wall biosynthesis